MKTGIAATSALIPPDALQAFGLAVATLAGHIAAGIVEERMSRPVKRYATSKDNPLGSRRLFLEAARAKRFETFMRGREVSAVWSDVDAWVRTRKQTPREKKADDDMDALLAKSAAPKRARGTSGR